MNLAEIRKKARQEKARESQPAESPALSAPEVGNAVATAAPDAAPVCDEEVLREPRCEEMADLVFAKETPEGTPADFDPVAILLAGRRTAGSASDTVDAPQRESSEVVGEVLKCLRFRVADEEYGVSLMEIREIIKPRDVTEVPRMPDFVAGVISLRGTIIPLFDLRLRLGLAANAVPGRERVIVAKRQEGSVGLLVDEVHQVISLSASTIEHAPPVLEGIDREFVTGIGRHGQQMIILLDLEKIVDISLR
jgi:purine-binding chemotaxis protein CheW